MAATAPSLAVIEPTLTPVAGIWDTEEAKLFARYRTTIQFTGRVMGGVPQKPEIIESWLRQRIIGGDEEIRLQMIRTMDELGYDVSADMTHDELLEMSKKFAQERSGNTFRRDERGLFIADYQVKACLKENVAILYPYSEKANRMGPTQKAARAFWAERVFIDEYNVHLCRDGVPLTEPDGKHLQIGHVPSPKGPKSTLTYYDYCLQPELTFTMSSLEDMVTGEMWQRVLLAAQRNGLGAIRSLSSGQFKVTAFDKVEV
jgi:hypothetical protein